MVILPLKCMFQEICQLKMNWDIPLPDKLHTRWVEITSDMATVRAIEVPRYVPLFLLFLYVDAVTIGFPFFFD